MITKAKILILIFIAFFTYGCNAPQKINQEVFNHLISFSKDGEYIEKTKRSREKYLKNPADFKPNVSPVDTILSGLEIYDKKQREKGKDTRIVFFVHGGLVTEANAIKRVERIYQHIKKDAYPIFILWRSGLPATYGNHLTRIRQGEVRESAKYTAPIYFLTDVVDIITHAPVAWLTAGTHSVRTGLLTDRADTNQSLEQISQLQDHVTFEGNGNEPNTAVNRAMWMATSPFKAVATPFVYTLAKPAWEVMLRRTNMITDPSLTDQQATTYSLPAVSYTHLTLPTTPYV